MLDAATVLGLNIAGGIRKGTRSDEIRPITPSATTQSEWGLLPMRGSAFREGHKKSSARFPKIFWEERWQSAGHENGWQFLADSVENAKARFLFESFVRDDQPRSETCRQIALAMRDEVTDLEAAGIRVIQIDEPALREGLPLLCSEWPEYLAWAVEAFRIASSGVRDETQIHTHMCYAEFQDIIEAVGQMDADVISIETSRSQMELLHTFAEYHYPNDIGPGVYDIHSPRIPAQAEMESLLKKASAVLSPSQLWVNPDCGLKTRRWEEVRPALAAMVDAARAMRQTAS
jgi:hypothetical protein